MDYPEFLLRGFHLLLTFVSVKSLTASRARSFWASAKEVDVAALFGVPGIGFQPTFNGPDDSADGFKGFDIEDRFLGFFIFVSICSILLNRCFPDTNKR